MKVFPNLGVRTKPLFHPQTKLNLFAQFFEHIDRSVFEKLVIQHSSDKYSGISTWTADTVSQLYKARWDVEVFFKHLKQLFREKSLWEPQKMQGAFKYGAP